MRMYEARTEKDLNEELETTILQAMCPEKLVHHLEFHATLSKKCKMEIIVVLGESGEAATGATPMEVDSIDALTKDRGKVQGAKKGKSQGKW